MTMMKSKASLFLIFGLAFDGRGGRAGRRGWIGVVFFLFFSSSRTKRWKHGSIMCNDQMAENVSGYAY